MVHPGVPGLITGVLCIRQLIARVSGLIQGRSAPAAQCLSLSGDAFTAHLDLLAAQSRLVRGPPPEPLMFLVPSIEDNVGPQL